MNPQVASVKPLTELREYLADFYTRCRSLRFFGPAFRVTVAQDIAADVLVHQNKLASDAVEAKQHDQTAEEKADAAMERLKAVLSDDIVDEKDRVNVRAAIAELQTARAEIRASKILDHMISEEARA
jgi:hypothetical protein